VGTVSLMLFSSTETLKGLSLAGGRWCAEKPQK